MNPSIIISTLPAPSRIIPQACTLQQMHPCRIEIKYTLTDHALLRLKERSSMEPYQVLALLEDGAYERLARRIDKARLYANPKWEGLTLEELRARGVDTMAYCYKHVLIWSVMDQKAFTLIIAVKSRRVITVLESEDQENGISWADKVTPEAIRLAQERQAESMIPLDLRGRVHARVSWITPENGTRGKNLKGTSFTKNDLPLEDESLLDLATRSLAHAVNGHDIRLQLVSKDGGSQLMAEYLIERDDLDDVQVTPL